MMAHLIQFSLYKLNEPNDLTKLNYHYYIQSIGDSRLLIIIFTTENQYKCFKWKWNYVLWFRSL